ncbi:MAG: hypothetical protein IT327_22565 [Anaerolineae bacterium]|nr:hypothetical protein [Anaerolineae bacterium]
MNARYYVPYLNRFLSADTIVPNPNNPQSFNRYSYVYNNPVKFTDSTGHATCEDMPWECDSKGGWADDGSNPSPFPTTLPQNSNFTWVHLDLGIIQPYATEELGTVYVPLHTSRPEDNNDMFPYEAAAIAAYYEQHTLHPSAQYLPDAADWLETYFVGDSLGITQTIKNRADNRAGGDYSSIPGFVTDPNQYAFASYPKGWVDVEDPVYLEFVAIAYAALYADVPDYIHGMEFFGHYNTSGVNGNLTDRAFFGPSANNHPYGVPVPATTIDCATTGC